MSRNFYTEDEMKKREESINRYKSLFTDFDKNTPSLADALNQMFKASNLEEKKVNEFTKDIIKKCKSRIDPDFKKLKEKYENITEEDAYIICCYTCESEDRKYSPYRLLNQSLVSNNRENGVGNVSKYLYLFLKSLRKLPRFKPKDGMLYRCLTVHVSLVDDEKKKDVVPYKIGNIKTFWGFTSTSPDPNLTYTFLKGEQMKTGTVFSLSGDVWGYNIEPFNFFKEKEILLEPERKFKILNALPPVNGIINITCEILKTNLILNDIILDSNKITYNNEDDENNYNINLNELVIKFEIEAKINEEGKYTSGMGLLCNIPSKNIKVFITYYHLMNLDFINYGEKMTLFIDRNAYEINIKLNRFKYTNKDLDITIIEILGTDNIASFIEMDRYVNSKNYSNMDIIAVSLKNDQELDKLDGKITKKEEKDEYYTCNIETKKEGIIILKENFKLIGIIKDNKSEINIIQMNTIINKINFIKCEYEIKKENVGKDIQLINNKGKYDFEIKNGEIEKEIKILINGEIKSNVMKNKFSKEGNYLFYIISSNDLTDMSWMFNECSELKEINLTSFNTSKVTNMSYMFNKCFSLKKLNLTSFKTNQVTNMRSMFCNCRSLTGIDLSLFNTEKVEDMSFMFFNCSSLKELNLSSFYTEKVKNMSYMFSHCSSLNKLNISTFNTEQVIEMTSMFSHCTSLKELNLIAFNISQVVDMSSMFLNCSSLKELNLSSFNTNKQINMIFMFDALNKKCKISYDDEQIDKQIKNTPGCIII